MAKSIDTFFTKKSATSCICPAHKNFLYEFTYNDIITNRPKGTEEVDVVILLEHREYASVTRLFSNLVKYLVPKDKTYAIINALGCTPKGFKSSDTIKTYVKCKKYHIKAQLDKLKPKVIITTGRAIYHISESKEMLFHHFYSLHEDDTWFYAPEYGCKVYPIPALYTFINTRKEEEMCSLLDVFELDFTKKQFGRAIKSLSDPVKRRPELKYVHLEDPNKFLQELYDNKEIEFIAVDSETTGKNYWKDKIINLTIAYDKITGYFLPFEKINIELLNKVLLSKKLIFQNGKFDMKFLIANGIKGIKCYFDTMIAGYAINENSKNSLKFFVWVYTLYGGYENELRTYLRELGSHDFSVIPLPILLKYACTDAIMTYAIFRYFENRLKEEPEVEYNFYNYMMPAVNMLTEVEMHGIKIDQKYLYEYNESLFNKLKEIDKQLEDYFGESFNYNSKKKLSEKLREKGIEPLIDDKGNVKIAKNGDLILDKDALAEYAKKGNVACGLLVERNHISKEISGLSLKKYYQENVLDNEIEQIKQKSMNDLFALCKTVEIEEEEEEIEDEDPLTKFDIDEISETVSKGLLSSVYKGALYGEFNVSGTTTGRLSSSGGLVGTINFQNFPKTYEFRRIFAPRDGYIFAEFDFVGMEVSQLSQHAGPGPLEKVVLDDLDPHCYTGVDVYRAVTGRSVTYEEFFHKAKVEEDKTFKEYRGIAKACNFSFSYGATEFGIAGTLGISVEQGKLLLDTYMKTYPEVAAYMKKYREDACEYGYVENLLGKRRRFPQLTYRGRDTKINAISNLLNGAINAPIQGTSGQTTYIAMTRIHNEFKEKNMKSRILANVHDSILFEIYEQENDEARKIIEYWMTYPYYENYNGNKVRLKVDPKISHVWGFSDKEDAA